MTNVEYLSEDFIQKNFHLDNLDDSEDES